MDRLSQSLEPKWMWNGGRLGDIESADHMIGNSRNLGLLANTLPRTHK
jgi:hypothetical protein